MAGNGKEKGRKGLAWISFAFAVIGGAALAATFVGGIVANILGVAPSWVAGLLLAGAIAGIAIDIFLDGEPNQVALYGAMALPSLARSTTGQLGSTVTEWSNQALAQASDILGLWLGVGAGIGLAVVCVGISYVMGRRVVAKGGGGGGRR